MQSVAIAFAEEALEKHEIEKDVRCYSGRTAAVVDFVAEQWWTRMRADCIVHQEGSRQEVGTDLARRCRQELWQLCHSHCQSITQVASTGGSGRLELTLQLFMQSGNFIYMYINQLAFVRSAGSHVLKERASSDRLELSQLLFKAG